MPSVYKPLLLVFLAFFAACSSSTPVDPNAEPDAKEIKAKSKSSLDLPEFELFSNSKRQYQAGLYSVAHESFVAIKDSYPTGPYAEFAELKVADSLFQTKDYKAAGNAYEQFSKNSPASSALPYSLLRAARSFELSSAGIGRDPTPLQKALELYDSLLNRFPNSVYVASARYYKRGVEELLAGYEQQVIDFYSNSEKSSASLARDKEFKKRFGTDSEDFEVGTYDRKAILAVGPVNPEKLKTAKAILKQLPPLNVINYSPQDLKAKPTLAEGKFAVTTMSCDRDEKMVLLTIEPRPKEAPTSLNPIKQGDSIQVSISDLTTIDEETKTYSCFSEGDLTISSSGMITLKAAETISASALYVDNPSRVIINLQ